MKRDELKVLTLVFQRAGRIWRLRVLAATDALDAHLANAFAPTRLPASPVIEADVVLHLHLRKPVEHALARPQPGATAQPATKRFTLFHQDFRAAVWRTDHELPDWEGGAVCNPTPQAIDALLSALEQRLGPARCQAATRASPRDEVIALRTHLRTHGHYVFRARGHSMRPFIDDDQPLFIAATKPAMLAPGQVVLCWIPGPRAKDDRLLCHRLINVKVDGKSRLRAAIKGDNSTHIAHFFHGVHAEILGVVVPEAGPTSATAISQGDPARLLLSLLSRPLLALWHTNRSQRL